MKDTFTKMNVVLIVALAAFIATMVALPFVTGGAEGAEEIPQLSPLQIPDIWVEEGKPIVLDVDSGKEYAINLRGLSGDGILELVETITTTSDEAEETPTDWVNQRWGGDAILIGGVAEFELTPPIDLPKGEYEFHYSLNGGAPEEISLTLLLVV